MAETASSQVQLPQKRKEKSITDLETVLESLDLKLETVVGQLESVKETRDQLLETTRNLQHKLETCGDPGMNQEQVEKLKAASSEIKKREEMVRALERRELILSHSMLSVISNWADKVEKSISKTNNELDDVSLTEIYTSETKKRGSSVSEDPFPPPPPNPSSSSSQASKTKNKNQVIHITSAQEWTERLSRAGGKLVVVDWFATWCSPCQRIAPQLEELALKYPKVVFLKVDIEQLEDLAVEYKVSSMPTFHFMKNGKSLDHFSGANIDKVISKIKEFT